MNKKLILPLIIYIIIFIAGLTSMIVSYALCIVIEIIDNIWFLFEAFMITKGYKYRYLILGKEFNKQVEEYKTKAIEELSNDDLKIMKNLYRRTGHIQYNINSHLDTPLDYFKSVARFKAVNDNENLDLIILRSIYEVLGSGNELYRMIEDINVLISYEEFVNAIKESKYINDNIKELLLNPNLKRPYEYINYEHDFPGEEKTLEEFEKNYSFLSDENIDSIKNNMNDIMITLFKKRMVKDSLKTNTIIVYYSLDTDIRISVIKNNDDYTGCIEKFEFVEEDNKELINTGGLYKQINNLGIYDSLDSIKNDLSLMYELDKYEIVNIGKISNE